MTEEEAQAELVALRIRLEATGANLVKHEHKWEWISSTHKKCFDCNTEWDTRIDEDGRDIVGE